MNKEKIIELINKPETQSYLKEHRIKHLRLVGSMAKDMQHSDSDVDFVYESEQDKPVGLMGIIQVRQYLKSFLTKEIDLVNEKSINKFFKESILANKIQVY